MGTIKTDKVSETLINLIEQQIDEEQRNVKYDIREFTIEYYVDKYSKGEETDKNELFVPEYQREFIWDNKRQSRFIESLMLGLPVPLVFVAENEDGRLEIVDGSQRVRTLNAFLHDELCLTGLEKLNKMNDLCFSQLPLSRQRKFKNIPMRMIVLSSQATEGTKNEMFDRINTSAVSLLPMETRRGIYKGPFMNFVTKLAENKQFVKLCPQNDYMKHRREEEEMVLRLFAFSDTYPSFKCDGVSLKEVGVAKFLDTYLSVMNRKNDTADMEKKEQEFERLISFIKKCYPGQGFAKAKGVVGVSKPYFEAIAIGALFALKKRENLAPTDLSWSRVDKNHINEFFRLLSSRYHTHTPDRLKARIEYACEQYLNA